MEWPVLRSGLRYGRPNPQIIATNFAFAGMETGAYFNSQLPDFLTDGTSTTHTASGTVESGQNAIAGTLDLTTAKSGKVAFDYRVMIVEKATPAAIAEFRGFLG